MKTSSITLEKKAVKRPYEVVVLLHPDAPVEAQKEVFKKNKAIIEKDGGSLVSLDTWGKRSLATPINKLKKALYFHSCFEADSQSIIEMERVMRLNDKVLRFTHTRLDERVPLSKHLEKFKAALVESANREKEREAKIQARRAGGPSGRGMDRGPRPDRGDRPSRVEGRGRSFADEDTDSGEDDSDSSED